MIVDMSITIDTEYQVFKIKHCYIISSGPNFSIGFSLSSDY